MTTAKLKCPKCKREMEEGFIADFYGGGTARPGKWVEGQPEKSFWTGIKTSGKELIRITTYRCTGCGYLESYARPGDEE